MWLCSPCPTVSLVPSLHFGGSLIAASLTVVSQVAHTIDSDLYLSHHIAQVHPKRFTGPGHA